VGRPSMIGSLLKFDCEKRELYSPGAPLYENFDGAVGLCIRHRVNSSGEPYVAVKWLKPVEHGGRLTGTSSFALSNFIVVGRIKTGE
jgi:hypothetical protein